MRKSKGMPCMQANISDAPLQQAVEGNTIQVDHHTAPAHWEVTRRRLAGSFYLSEAFARILEKQGNNPLFFSWMENQHPTGIALGFLTNQWRRWPGNVIARGFHWQTHPAVADNDQLAQTTFVRTIVATISRLGVTSIHLHSEDAALSPSLLESDGFARQDRLEFRIRLASDPAEVLASIASRKRSYLRSALKNSTITVKEAHDRESVRLLIDMQHASRERRRARGEDYQIATQKATDNIFSNYVQPRCARLFLSYADDQPLSGILLHVDGRTAYYTMSGCLDEGFEVSAPLITVWKAIEQLCSDGYEIMNMGGVAASSADAQDLGHGLYRFKRSFGGDEVRCTTWHKDMTGWRSALSKRLF